MMEIIKANFYDSLVLTEITKKSKAYWVYSQDQMKDWSELLTITSEYIQKNEVYKLVVGKSIVAYYSYFEIEENGVRLDNLFVLPENIGKGYGKLLMNDFILKIKQSGTKRIILGYRPKRSKIL